MEYSLLMSVYIKEKAEYFRESLDSIFRQTVKPDDFVLVCDGPLNPELDAVVAEYQEIFGQTLNVVRLEKNSGLGNALNEGVKHCKYELIARADSDDICIFDRFEKQIEIFKQNSDIDICSGEILEFQNETSNITGKRSLPEKHEDIVAYSKKRNPFNHPSIMFKKSAIEQAGGYSEEYHLFEDYYLWVRMLKNGFRGYNIQNPLVYMRTSPDMFMRRGGKAYADDMLKFHKWMKNEGWSGAKDYYTGALPHALVCVMPNSMRTIVYSILHR